MLQIAFEGSIMKHSIILKKAVKIMAKVLTALNFKASTGFFRIMHKLVAIALPISAGRLLNILAGFLAMMMVAQFGKQELAAGFLAISSTNAILTLTSTIFYAIGIRIRYHLGQSDHPLMIGILIKNGFFLALLLAIPTACIVTYLDKILLMLHQDPQIVALTSGYFRYAGIGIFPIITMIVIGQFYIGIGKPYVTLLIELVSLPLTFIASYGFISGHFGLTGFGLGGVSIANLLVQTSLLLVMLLIMGYSRANKAYQLFKAPWRLSWRVCKSILTLGVPIGIQFGGELSAMAAAGYLTGYFGVNALAALQISSQYSMAVFMLNFGLAQALSLKVSEGYGKKEINEEFQYLGAAIILLIAYLLPVALLFCTSAPQLAAFYMGTDHLQPEFNHLTQVFFALSPLFFLIDGIRNLLTAVLRGLHDSTTATRINLLTLWFISLPVSWLIGFVFQGGAIGVRVGFFTGFFAAVIYLAISLYQKLKTHLVSPNQRTSWSVQNT